MNFDFRLEEGNTVQGRGRRRKVLIVAVCVLVGIGVVAFWPGEREPEYNGKKLSEWAKAYRTRLDDDAKTIRLIEQEQHAADDAIRHIGTNSIPWLLRWLTCRPPAWKVQLARIVERIPIKSIRSLYRGPDFSSVLQPRLAAVRAFKILGPEAAPAVPALTQIVKDWQREFYTSTLALSAMSFTGKDALPPLLRFLEDAELKEYAAIDIVSLSDTGVDITPAMPAILMIDRETSAIRKTNFFHSHYAIGDGEIMSGMHHPHFLTSALTNCMHHTNLIIQIEAINALGRLGKIGRPAVPALKEALDVRVIAVQEAAIDALESIAPEVLTNPVKDF